VTQVVALVCIAAALIIGASIGLFYYHSSTRGHQLVAKEKQSIARTHSGSSQPSVTTPVQCTAPSDANTTSPQGLIEATSISLQAPVLGGDGDPQLNIAVGHVPGSIWPGEPGTALFAAHDVTYFSHIDGLSVGQTVKFATPCATYNYRVTGHQIVKAGSPIYTSPLQNLMVLETCYPLNALYITPKRYLVTAELTSIQKTGISAVLPPVATPTVPAPAALASQGLTLATNKLFLGTLSLQGSPSLSWSQSPAPIDDEAAVISEYFGALRSAEQEQPSWWQSLTTSQVPFSDSMPLHNAAISSYSGQVDPVLSVNGHTLTGASLSLTERIGGGSAPGLYQLLVTFSVEHGTLLITQWKMTPAST
jgi:sortase A